MMKLQVSHVFKSFDDIVAKSRIFPKNSIKTGGEVLQRRQVGSLRHRKSVLPKNLELILYLRENDALWDIGHPYCGAVSPYAQ